MNYYETETFVEIAELIVKFNKNNSNLPINSVNRKIESLVDYGTPLKDGSICGLNITTTVNGEIKNEVKSFKSDKQLITYLKRNV